jgi:hypothetical protein
VRLGQLTLDEHRRLGITLRMISMECGADRLNKYKIQSETQRNLWRMLKAIDALRCALDGLMFQQHPEAEPSIYYGCDHLVEMKGENGRHVEELFGALGVICQTINKKVPARILDLYIKCDRVLYSVCSSVRNRPEDIRTSVLNQRFA